MVSICFYLTYNRKPKLLVTVKCPLSCCLFTFHLPIAPYNTRPTVTCRKPTCTNADKHKHKTKNNNSEVHGKRQDNTKRSFHASYLPHCALYIHFEWPKTLYANTTSSASGTSQLSWFFILVNGMCDMARKHKTAAAIQIRNKKKNKPQPRPVFIFSDHANCSLSQGMVVWL